MNNSSFEDKFLSAFPREQWTKRRICLAVSGGADSVAALRAMTRIAERFEEKEQLFVVTVDHKTRGAESDSDVQFVCDLARSLSLKSFVRRIDPDELQFEAQLQGSWESAARTLRYRLLIDACKSQGARFLVVAHHQDDQLETLLFRLFRGSGLEGLRGVRPWRTIDESLVLVRPMLNLGRKDVLKYLESLRQTYRTDSSNASSLYDRNRIRNELTPVLESIFPGRWKNALLRLSQIADETERHFDQELDRLDLAIQKLRRNDRAYQLALEEINAPGLETSPKTNDSIDVPLAPFQNMSDELVVRYFRRIWKEKKWPLVAMGAEEWRRLAKAAKEKTNARQLPGDVFVTVVDGSTIRLERNVVDNETF